MCYIKGKIFAVKYVSDFDAEKQKYKTTLFIFIEYSLRCRSAHIRKNHGLNPITDEIEIKKIKKIFFCINVNKNAKEKLSFGFWVSKNQN